MNRDDGQRQGGQSIILVAVAMVALVIFVAVTVDMSNAYHHRRVAQNAADAAALAGAEELGRQMMGATKSDSRIKAEMNDFAERNGIEDTNGILADSDNTNVEGYYLDRNLDQIGTVGAGTVPRRALGIRAITHIVAPAFFGGIMGFDGYPVQARAAVAFDAACTGAYCMLPIAIHDTGFLDFSQDPEAHTCFNLWDGAGSGNFGWVNWSLNPNRLEDFEGVYEGMYSCQDDSLAAPPWNYEGPQPDDCSAQCLDINMDPNYCLRVNPDHIPVGSDVGGTTGVKNGEFIIERLKFYIEQGLPVQILVYDSTKGNKKTGQEGGCATNDNENGLRYTVKGFACFIMTGFRLSVGQGGAVRCDITKDGVLDCGPCKSVPGEDTIDCEARSGTYECDPLVVGDYPEECTTADGDPCEFETGDVNRISGYFTSCVAGQGGNCKAIGNMMAPSLDE